MYRNPSCWGRRIRRCISYKYLCFINLIFKDSSTRCLRYVSTQRLFRSTMLLKSLLSPLMKKGWSKYVWVASGEIFTCTERSSADALPVLNWKHNECSLQIVTTINFVEVFYDIWSGNRKWISMGMICAIYRPWTCCTVLDKSVQSSPVSAAIWRMDAACGDIGDWMGAKQICREPPEFLHCKEESKDRVEVLSTAQLPLHIETCGRALPLRNAGNTFTGGLVKFCGNENPEFFALLCTQSDSTHKCQSLSNT